MSRILRMPEVAANAVEAVLQSWPIAENTPYAAADVIVIVETEKAVVDVEAETGGVILKTLVPEGAEVKVGAPIAIVGEPAEKPADLDALLAELGLSDPDPVTAPVSPEPQPAASAVIGVSAASSNGSGGRVFSSPLARRLAREAGLPVEKIPGTGPNGRIIRRDVEAAIRSQGSSQTAEAPAQTDSASKLVNVPTATAETASQTFTDVPHSRLRAAVASQLTESKRTTPH